MSKSGTNPMHHQTAAPVSITASSAIEHSRVLVPYHELPLFLRFYYQLYGYTSNYLTLFMCLVHNVTAVCIFVFFHTSSIPFNEQILVIAVASQIIVFDSNCWFAKRLMEERYFENFANAIVKAVPGYSSNIEILNSLSHNFFWLSLVLSLIGIAVEMIPLYNTWFLNSNFAATDLIFMFNLILFIPNTFLAVVLWFCFNYEIYKAYPHIIYKLEFKDIQEHTLLIKFKAFARVMSEYTKVWTYPMIVRYIGGFIFLFVKIVQILQQYDWAVAYGNTRDEGKKQYELIYGTFNLFLSLILLICNILMIVIPAYINDSFIFDMKKKVLSFISYANEAVRRPVLTNLKQVSYHSGHGLLTFCGIEMSMDKVTIIISIYVYMASTAPSFVMHISPVSMFIFIFKCQMF